MEERFFFWKSDSLPIRRNPAKVTFLEDAMHVLKQLTGEQSLRQEVCNLMINLNGIQLLSDLLQNYVRSMEIKKSIVSCLSPLTNLHPRVHVLLRDDPGLYTNLRALFKMCFETLVTVGYSTMSKVDSSDL